MNEKSENNILPPERLIRKYGAYASLIKNDKTGEVFLRHRFPKSDPRGYWRALKAVEATKVSSRHINAAMPLLASKNRNGDVDVEVEFADAGSLTYLLATINKKINDDASDKHETRLHQIQMAKSVCRQLVDYCFYLDTVLNRAHKNLNPDTVFCRRDGCVKVGFFNYLDKSYMKANPYHYLDFNAYTAPELGARDFYKQPIKPDADLMYFAKTAMTMFNKEKIIDMAINNKMKGSTIKSDIWSIGVIMYSIMSATNMMPDWEYRERADDMSLNDENILTTILPYNIASYTIAKIKQKYDIDKLSELKDKNNNARKKFKGEYDNEFLDQIFLDIEKVNKILELIDACSEKEIDDAVESLIPFDVNIITNKLDKKQKEREEKHVYELIKFMNFVKNANDKEWYELCGGDPYLVYIMRKCLDINPVKRATISELSSFIYLSGGYVIADETQPYKTNEDRAKLTPIKLSKVYETFTPEQIKTDPEHRVYKLKQDWCDVWDAFSTDCTSLDRQTDNITTMMSLEQKEKTPPASVIMSEILNDDIYGRYIFIGIPHFNSTRFGKIYRQHYCRDKSIMNDMILSKNDFNPGDLVKPFFSKIIETNTIVKNIEITWDINIEQRSRDMEVLANYLMLESRGFIKRRNMGADSTTAIETKRRYLTKDRQKCAWIALARSIAFFREGYTLVMN